MGNQKLQKIEILNCPSPTVELLWTNVRQINKSCVEIS